MPRPPRIRLRTSHRIIKSPSLFHASHTRLYATATTSPSSLSQSHSPPPFPLSTYDQPTIQLYHPLQPPAHKAPELRKTQLHRSYTSLLRTSPLLLFFQHNNLKATEWASVRRELAAALRAVSSSDPSLVGQDGVDPADVAKLHVIQTSIFGAALRVVEFHDGEVSSSEESSSSPSPTPSSTSSSSSSSHQQHMSISPQGQTIHTHALSPLAHSKTQTPENFKKPTTFDTFLSGPLAVLSFPILTPQHLSAALSILSPTPGSGSKSPFPAPRRKTNPGYYEPAVQNGIQKLMLLGARVEGRRMDREGVQWVGGIQGGLAGLRGQLVNLLSLAGVQLAGTLEGASKAVWATVEGRRMDLESQEKGEGEKKDE